MKDISKPQDASLEQSLPEVLMRLVSELHDVAYLIERVEPQLLELGDANLMQHPDSIKVLQGIDLWSPRAEVVIIHEELPWARLLAGHAPDTIIDEDKQGLVDYLRGKGLTLHFLLDLTNGLAREAEARELLFEAPWVEGRQRNRRHAHLAREPAAERLFVQVTHLGVVDALEVAAGGGQQLEAGRCEALTEEVALALVETG